MGFDFVICIHPPRALHFLGLLKVRIAPTPTLPIELWQEIVRRIFSCEPPAVQVLCVGTRLELVPFPALPPEAALELLADALQKRTGPSDVALLDTLCRRPARDAAALVDAAAPEMPGTPGTLDAPIEASPAAPGSPADTSAGTAAHHSGGRGGGGDSDAVLDGAVRSSLVLSMGDQVRVHLSLTLARAVWSAG